jgi:NitT/TauT family transport system substrate-binding protein
MARLSRYKSVVSLLAMIAAFALIVAACGSSSSSSSKKPTAGSAAPSTEPVTLRLGYFPNVTHASALVGVEGGIFKKNLAKNVTLATQTFNAGGDAVTALLSGAIDATYVGPSPAINAFQKSGRKIRIISGAASGGAYFVVKAAIKSAADVKGKKIADPQLGATQDVALRSWLKSKGLNTNTSGGGDVTILPQDNAQTLQTFKSGDIDGAWVPEPWATRLVKEGGGKILVDEKTLWPNGQYPTTNLIVSTDFLDAHADVVKQLLEGQVAADDLIKANPTQAQKYVGDGIEKITQKALAPDLIAASFKDLLFTNDPIASALRKSAQEAESLGLLKSVDLKGIYDLKPLNTILKTKGQTEVKS